MKLLIHTQTVEVILHGLSRKTQFLSMKQLIKISNGHLWKYTRAKLFQHISFKLSLWNQPWTDPKVHYNLLIASLAVHCVALHLYHRIFSDSAKVCKNVNRINSILWNLYVIRISCNSLRPKNQIDDISQTTFSNVFSIMKMNEFRLGFHWSLFLRFELTIFQYIIHHCVSCM